MLDRKVEDWIITLRKDDQANTRNFLTTSLEFLKVHQDFLRGAGYYVVGSAFAKKSYWIKGGFGKRRERENKLWGALMKKAIEKFGKEAMERDCSGRGTINTFIEEGYARIKSELDKKEHYQDIDCVLVGLPRKEMEPQLEIWKRFAENLRIKFPHAEHPNPTDDNGFSYWDAYDGDIYRYVVRDYKLKIPTQSNPTEIHFMLYQSDETFGSEHGEDFLDHGPSKDVNLKMWKQQQEEDKLPFLTIAEF